ncbi:hypothetical protein GmHk_18G051751 [Glycine max]|nr:hypothetical protein GmHk_18G051751 [Glycine max]
MVATTYQTSLECSEETIIDILVAGFSGKLKGWWDNYLTNDENTVKTDFNGKVITNDDNKEIPDAVNTLIFIIAQHFIGDPSLWKDRSVELLSNLKCRTLANFRWYRDTFLTRVYTKEDTGLPRSLGDKIRDKIRSQSVNGDIPYKSLSYSQLISYVQKVALKICQDDKIQRQLAKEKAQTKRDLGSFYEQFRLPTCPKQKKKQNLRKESNENKTSNKKRFPRRRYSHKPSSSKETETPKPKITSNIVENLNITQQDDQPSSTDDDERKINTLTREQDLLFEAINSVPDPQEKKVFLEKLKKTLETKPKQKDFVTNNKFDVSNIFKRLENTSAKPTTIQDLQTEINNLKKEVKELRQQQEIHQIILSQLEGKSDSESKNLEDEKDEGNENENLEDEMFMGLINKIKIKKFYINKIIINDFVLDTMALFDTGVDSNCILEGLLSSAIIENQGFRINTNFLLVKNLKNEVILGTPFIRALFPLQISKEGITTTHLGRKITFNFSTKPISRNINFIEKKINQINFLKEEVSFNNIQIQ